MNELKLKAKKEALKKMKRVMSELGGRSLMDGLSKGAVVAKVIAKDSESLKEGLKKAADIVEQREDHGDEAEEDREYGNLSKEELIKLLKEKS